MNNINSILNAVHCWLLEAGYESYLNLSARPGIPCYGATPNVSVLASTGLRTLILLQRGQEVLEVWRIRLDNYHDNFGPVKLLLADPELFERVQAVVDNQKIRV